MLFLSFTLSLPGQHSNFTPDGSKDLKGSISAFWDSYYSKAEILNSEDFVPHSTMVPKNRLLKREMSSIKNRKEDNIMQSAFENRPSMNTPQDDSTKATGLSELFPLHNINSGATAFSFGDQNWNNDQFVDGGDTYSAGLSINETENDRLYRSERFGISFNYSIPVNDSGPFTVRLHFAEIHHGVKNENGIGARIFNVDVENGQGQLQNYDIIEQSGAPATAIIEAFNNIIVNDGYLNIAFTTVKNKAKISGIEILSSRETSNRPPLVSDPGEQFITKGQLVNLQIQATDPDGDSLFFSSSILPNSLVINSKTGLISGIVETSGNSSLFLVYVTATDPGGLTDTQSILFRSIEDSLTSLYKINAGGPSFASNNLIWQADEFYDAGSSYKNPIEITGTINDELYQSERSDTSFNYNIPITDPGPFTVRLHFAEIFHGVQNTKGIGARIFNVDIENGQAQLQNYDIIERAGGPAKAILEIFNNIEVTDGNLNIAFTTVKNKAKISGIDILSAGIPLNQPPTIANPGTQNFEIGEEINLQIQANDPDGDTVSFVAIDLPASLTINPTTGLISGTILADIGDYPVTILAIDQNGLLASDDFIISISSDLFSESLRYNSGGGRLLYTGYHWDIDRFADAGDIYSTFNFIEISNTIYDRLYRSERYGSSFTYNIPVDSPGVYMVKLHFAEIFHGLHNTKGIGARIFNVDVENGQGQLLNYDIIEKAGATATAIIESFEDIYVSDGYLSVAFTSIKNNAKISAIEVIKYGEEINNTHLYASTDLSENNVNIYPNPIHDRFKINIKLEQEENVFIYLSDGFGKKTDLGSYDLPQGSTSLDFDISNLNLHRGLFYLVIKSDRRDHPTRKLFIGQ